MSNESETWVKNWLIFCSDNEIKPWDFDFKQFYILEEITLKTSHLDLWLKYKANMFQKLDSNTRSFTGTLTTSEPDPDKAAGPVYNELGWPNDERTKGDTMNSFKTSFTKCIMTSSNKDLIYKQIDINPNGKLDLQYDTLLKKDEEGKPNYLLFENIKPNVAQMNRFALLHQTIGDFWTMNTRGNIARGSSFSIGDYMDITLCVVYDFLSGLGSAGSEAWDNYVDKYCLQPYICRKSKQNERPIGELWQGHFNSNSVYPKTSQDFNQFYTNANLIIEERGKWLTKKLCDQLELTNLAFYQEDLANMTEIKYFDQIKGIMR